MSHALILGALALAPVLTALLYVYRRDQHEPEPPHLVFVAFCLGAIAVLPAVVLQLSFLPARFPQVESLASLFLCCIFVSSTEELAKFLPLYRVFKKHPEFDEPLDGIVYGAAIALGFAAIENLLYVFSYGVNVALLRMFTAVPAHTCFGIIMGYYLGQAKFFSHHEIINHELDQSAHHERPIAQRRPYVFMCILCPLGFHLIYDILIFSSSTIAYLLAFFLLIYSITLSERAITLHQKLR